MSKYIDTDEVDKWLSCGCAYAIRELPIIEVSEDCVSREHLKSFGYINKGDFNSVETIREWIDNAPSVIPKPKDGEWISKHNGYWTCSECGLSFLFYAKGNYCPNCGCRMKGADDE